MTTDKNGKVIGSMLEDYRNLVAGTSALAFDFIIKHRENVQRDIEATLKEGAKAGHVSGIRHTYSKQFGFAGFVLVQGRKANWVFPSSVEEFMTEIEVFHRAHGAKKALESASPIKSWADFVKAGRKLEGMKAEAKRLKDEAKGETPKAGRKGSKSAPVEVMSGELVIPDTIAETVTAGMVIRFAFNRLESADTLDMTAEEIAIGEKLLKKLGSILKIAKTPNHPINA